MDQKSPRNHPFKGVNPTNMLLPHLIPPNPIFGPELSKEIGSLKRKSPFLDVA
jgi:hypothetical protein